MDVGFDQPNRNRRFRRLGDMKKKTEAIFEISLRFLEQVDARVGKT